MCPGSFDPVTNGHLDIIERTARHFDDVIVAVTRNPQKSGSRFSLEERQEMLAETIGHLANVRIEWLTGLVVDFAHLTAAVPLPTQCGPSSHPIECRSACHGHLYTGHGAIADAKCLGHLLYSITPRQPSAYDGFDLGARPWAPEAHSSRLGAFQARLYATADHSPLKLGKCAGHLEEHPSGSGGGVDGLLLQYQRHTDRLQLAQRVQQVQQRTAEAIQRPGEYHVEPPSRGILQQRIQARSLFAPFRA
jgi:cytidyltransferase-like protein